MIDNSQTQLIKKFDAYFKHQTKTITDPNIRQDINLAFGNKSGLCFGLVMYWLYSQRIGEGGKFEHRMQHALTWDAGKFAATKAKRDSLMEEFINNAVFLHHHDELMLKDRQHQVENNFAVLTNDFYPHIQRENFSVSFVFNKMSLQNLIKDYIFENKMIIFSNAMHVIGVILQDATYHVFNPDSKLGIRSLPAKSVKKLAAIIFDELAVTCKSKKYIALNISGYDITEELDSNNAIAQYTYPDALEYCNNLLLDAEYTSAVVNHPNILRVAMRYNDFKILDLVFNRGYKHVRSNIKYPTELSEALEYHDQQAIEYLFSHNIDIDYKPKNSESALAFAIRNKMHMETYNLLRYNADPNIQITKGRDTLGWAILFGNREAAILLLAAGADCDSNARDGLLKLGGRNLLESAVNLNKIFLKLTEPVVLKDNDPHIFLNVLKHAKLIIDVGFSLDALKIQVNDQQYIGQQVIEYITKYYKSKPNIDIDSFVDFAEIYKLLKCLHKKEHDFKGSKELAEIIPRIIDLITNKPISEHDKNQILQIAMVQTELEYLKNNLNKPIYSKQLLLSVVKTSLNKINKYLSGNKIDDINRYIEEVYFEKINHRPAGIFFKPPKDLAKSEREFRTMVMPHLKM